MEIKIVGSSKEIADFVNELQNRQIKCDKCEKRKKKILNVIKNTKL